MRLAAASVCVKLKAYFCTVCDSYGFQYVNGLSLGICVIDLEKSMSV